jgi:acetylornithine deacetylase/succinyl-diaminopimelate desuccinylase-like protein
MSAHDYARVHAKRFHNELIDLLKIPSISTQPEHADDVQRAALWLRDKLIEMGMQAQLYQKPGYLPLVYAEYRGAGENAPTVLVYGHYDVQPAVIEDGWLTEPFNPTERDGKIYARGAVDSKSHVLIQMKAVESLLKGGTAPVNIKFLFEGEEESGSEHIFDFVRTHPDLLKADVCVVSDGSIPHPNQPVLDYGLRGIICMEVDVIGPQRDLHSGHYGGVVHNPIQSLAGIMAKLHDEYGRITVPGFYDDVLPLTDEERTVLAGVEMWITEEWKAVANAPQMWGDPDYHIHERIGARPTLEFNGIAGGYAGEGFKTVLPSRAKLKLSCRLVPNQDPAKIFKLVQDYILSITPPTVHLTIRETEEGAPGVLLDRHSAAMRAVEAAYSEGWGVRPILSRAGGSVPVVAVFQQELDAQIVLMPFGYKGGGAHSTNEYVILEMFDKGIQTMLYFYEALSKG